MSSNFSQLTICIDREGRKEGSSFRQNEAGSTPSTQFHFLLDRGERVSIARGRGEGGGGDETTYARHSRAIVAFCGDKLQSLFLWELSPVSDGYSFRVHSADLVIPTRPSILIEIRLVQTWRFRDRPTIVRYPFEHFQSPIFFFVQQ